MTENLAQFLLVSSFGAILLWIDRRKILFLLSSGLLLGLCSVVRPTFVLASVAVALSLVFESWFLKNQFIQQKDSVKTGLVIVVVSSVVILCFAGYNFVRHGAFGISWGKSSLATSLTTKTVKVLERLPDQYATEREVLIAARDHSLVARGSSHTGSQYWLAARSEVSRITGKRDEELEKLILRMNLVLIEKAPLNYLLDVFQAIPGFWFPSTTQSTITDILPVRIFWTLFHFVWIGFFMLQLMVIQGASIIALIHRFRNSSQNFIVNANELTAYILAVVLIFYTMMVSCGLNIGLGRYRVPTDPLIMFLCFLGARISWRLAGLSRQP